VNKKSPLSAFLTAILIGGLILASAMHFGTVQAKPSVPEFTVTLEAHPYYVPPVYEIDPYTGENVTIHQGYDVQNKSIVFTIKSIPFTPYNDTDGNLIELYYHIRVKGHFEEDWTELDHINSSDSEYTIGSYAYGQNANNNILREITTGDTVDFQVETQVGYYTRVYANLQFYVYNFIGDSSGWSATQTLTIGEIQTPTSPPATTPTPTPTPSEEPQQTEQIEPIVGAAIVVAVIIAVLGLLIYLTKRK
jgi:hypothetical protein